VSAKVAAIIDQRTEGKLNKQIPFELHLAEQTVKADVSAILKKLRASDRTKAAPLLERGGGADP